MATQTQTDIQIEPASADGELLLPRPRSLLQVQSRDNIETPAPSLGIELSNVRSRQTDNFDTRSRRSFAAEQGSPARPLPQGVPPELPNLLAEIVFVLVCTAGQLIFSLTLGHITVNQFVFRKALDIVPSQIPWLLGSSTLASGLSVIVFGPLADLAPPKPLMVGAFLWEAVWNAVSAAVISPKLKVLFFVSRAMQGLAVGVLVSASMSILGRVYNPGMRKTRVFSMMAAGAPFGFWIGAIQGGALSSHLPWIFGSTSIFLCVCAIAAYFTIPPLVPARDSTSADVPSVKQFDYIGAALASLGSGLILFGLTQGSSVQWNPYTYSLVVVGFLMLVAFYFIEPKVARPLIPNGVWKIPGFVPVLLSYIFGFGAYGKLSPQQFDKQYTDVYSWCMAILCNPILDPISRSLAPEGSTLSPSQRVGRSRRRLGCLQNATCSSWTLDSGDQYDLLRHRKCIFPGAKAEFVILGIVDASCCSGVPRA